MSQSMATTARGDAVSLSIITPVLNGIDRIMHCIENVRRHAVTDYEHLIVDGGSSDGTLDVVRSALDQDPHIRLLTGPDRGQSHAMNKGVAAARGAIVGFLNVDDEYLAGGPALAMANLRSAPEPSFFWGACEIDFQGHAQNWIQQPWRLEAWRLLAGWKFGPHPVNPSSYFYHRSLHDAAGPYREDEHFVMDLEFIARAAPFLRSVVLTDQLIGRFHNAPGTKTHAYVQRPDREAHETRLLAPLRHRLSPWDRVKCETCRWALRTWRRFR
jgi:glycosyltransferase involved in cell wall biosynthesis